MRRHINIGGCGEKRCAIEVKKWRSSRTSFVGGATIGLLDKIEQEVFVQVFAARCLCLVRWWWDILRVAIKISMGSDCLCADSENG